MTEKVSEIVRRAVNVNGELHLDRERTESFEMVGGRRETIHCFLNPNGMLIGADWDWTKFEEILSRAERISKSGEKATAMGHPVAVYSDGRWAFFGVGL